MAKRYRIYDFEPLSLADGRKQEKARQQAVRERNRKNFTTYGLNTKNVISSLNETDNAFRSKVPLSQQREDYVGNRFKIYTDENGNKQRINLGPQIPEWTTRAEYEQLPSIERLEREEREQKRDKRAANQLAVALNASKEISAAWQRVQEKALYEKELRWRGLRVLNYLRLHDKQAAMLMEKNWLGT